MSSWLEVDFHGSTTIDEIDVYTTADSGAFYTEPTATQTFSSYGITSFDVQYWNGSSWTTVPSGSVTSNNKVVRKFNFTGVTTTKIRVVVNGAVDGVARINELEAWGNGAGRSTNVATTANGGTATAQNYTADSSYPGMHFQPSYANDGVLYANPPGDQYWRDEHGLSSWVEVDFSGSKTIDAIDVFTVADYPAYFAYPDTNQQFNYYGATSYDVLYWNGSSWVTVTGGSVPDNNLIWRRFSFTAITTSKIRVKVNTAVDSVARIVEVQAWTPVTTGPTAKINWMVTDQLGTPRMVFDESGSLAKMSRHDYLPFGEELTATQGLRTTTLGYAANDAIRQQFTQKERDIETGLDYFLARYYSSTQGRFTSADPIMMKRNRQLDPQRINLYAYVRNNPWKYVDATGEDIVLASQDANQQKVVTAALVEIAKTKSGREFLQKLENSKVTFELGIDTSLGTYGRNNTPKALAGTKGQKEGTAEIRINPDLIESDKKKNEDRKKQNETIRSYNQAVKDGQIPGEEKPLRQPIEGVPGGGNANQRNATAMANELVQSNGVVNGEITNQAEGDAATRRELTDSVPKANALINDPNKAAGDAARFVDTILKRKP